MKYSFQSYTRVIAVMAAVAGLFLLWPGKLYFLNDDFTHLYLTSQGKWLQHNSLRPVCDLSMWLDHKIWGLNAVGFHLTNALLHIATTILVYVLSKKLIQKYHQSAIASSSALWIASVFFVYAFHSETIYWVIGRSASLGAITFLLSLIFYLDRQRRKSFILSQLFFVVGLFTYESVWILPLVFLIISWIDIKQQTSTWKKEIGYIMSSFSLLVVYFIIRYAYIHQVIAEYEAGRFMSFDIQGIFKNLFKLLGRSFAMQSGSFFLMLLAFLLSLASVISFFFTRHKVFAVAIFMIWLVSYIPYLSLGIDTFGSEGERYLYLPSIFLCIIVGIGIINATRYYKYFAGLLFFFLHIALLHQNRKRYEVASAVTHQAIMQLNNLQNKEVLYIRELPEENNGALIFRDGFENAIQLLKEKDAVQRVVIITKRKGNYEFFNGVSEQQWIDGLPGNEGKDVVFDFSNNTLTIYQ
jgi:hypothetical protein